MRSFRPFLITAALVGAGHILPAHAVVFENKWQPGQKLDYDMALDGSLNLNTAADAGVIWAGVPLEVQLKGTGLSQMETLAVDPAGTGTVSVKVPQLSLQGEALGQKGELQVNNGVSKVLLNGKALALGPAGGANPMEGTKMLVNPPVTFKITRAGKLAGLEPMPSAVKPNTPAADDKPVPLKDAINQGALVQAVILQSLPSLWPGHEVQEGEAWHALVNWPAEDPAAAAKPLGDFQLTFETTETINGKQLARIKVDGAMELDPAKLAEINKDALEAAKKPGAKTDDLTTLTALGQKVAGNIWFDTAAGQIEKVELQVNARARIRPVKATGKPAEESWGDFTGSVKFQRREQA